MKEIPKIRAIYQQDIPTSKVVIFELDTKSMLFIDINDDECFYTLDDVLRDGDFMLFELEYDKEDERYYCCPVDTRYVSEVVNAKL